MKNKTNNNIVILEETSELKEKVENVIEKAKEILRDGVLYHEYADRYTDDTKELLDYMERAMTILDGKPDPIEEIRERNKRISYEEKKRQRIKKWRK